MNACSCLTLILACIVYWQARVLGHARRFEAEIVNYADDRAPRRRRREAEMAA